MKKVLGLIFILCSTILPANMASAQSSDSLPSWNDGDSKKAIIDFVIKVTDPAGEAFVPVSRRIAVFDNDGTLWSEKPYYAQLAFAIDRIKSLSAEHPEWENTQPFKAVLEDDLETVMAGGEQALLKFVMASHAGNTAEEFSDIVKQWLADARHPVSNRLYTEMVFQPMLELLSYLRANDFKTFIVSGGGIEFMRVWTEEIYGIPPEQVIGSSIKTKFEMRDGVPVLARLPEINFIDDHEGKPVGIHQHIGRRPIAAFGNSDGDLQMLQWVGAGEGPNFCLYVHHTDSKREVAYDRESAVGRLDKGLEEAEKRGWTVVDMEAEWKQVFSAQ